MNGYFIMLHQADITFINIFTPKQVTSKYIMQLLNYSGETDKNTVIVGDLNTLITAMDRSSKQKINKEITALNDT
mgnify:CR=1 FL=1